MTPRCPMHWGVKISWGPLHQGVKISQGPMHPRVETPQDPMHWGVSKVDLLKNPNGPMHQGVETPRGPMHRRVVTPRCPMYQGVRTHKQNFTDCRQLCYLQSAKFQIDSNKIKNTTPRPS